MAYLRVFECRFSLILLGFSRVCTYCRGRWKALVSYKKLLVLYSSSVYRPSPRSVCYTVWRYCGSKQYHFYSKEISHDLHWNWYCQRQNEYRSVIQTALIQQEIIDTHNQHPIIIVIRYRRIFRNDNLFEEIARQRQWALLLFHLCLVWNRIGRLDIITLLAYELHQYRIGRKERKTR